MSASVAWCARTRPLRRLSLQRAPQRCFARAERPRNHWKSRENRLAFAEELGAALKIRRYQDLRRLKARDVIECGGSGLLAACSNSTIVVLEALYPAVRWHAWKVGSVPAHYFDDRENRRIYFENSSASVFINRFADLIDITASAIPSSLRAQSSMLHSAFFVNLYPSYAWHNQCKALVGQPSDFLDRLGRRLSIKRYVAWHRVPNDDFVRFGGKQVLALFGYSAAAAVLKVYGDDFRFSGHLFESVPKGYWSDYSHRRVFMDDLASFYSVQNIRDFYYWSTQTLAQGGGGSILNRFNSSLYAVITDVYPELAHVLHPWLFNYAQKDYWRDDVEVLRLVCFLERELQLGETEDWNRISASDIANKGVQNAINKLGGIHRVLERVYPDRDWTSSYSWKNAKRAGQRSLVALVKELLPSEQVIENYKHPTLRFASDRPIELDVYLPHKALAFEYQGRQHYQNNEFFGSLDQRRENDAEKAEMCQRAGITLIAIPQTTLNRHALVATIKQYRKDILYAL